MKEVSQLDSRASAILENMPLRDQSDTLLGLLAFIARATDDPIKSIASVRQFAVRYLILGFDKLTLPSLAASIPAAVEKTLGSDRVPPAVREAWFALARSIFDLFVAEYEPLKAGIVGRLWKQYDRKWRLFSTLLLPDRIVFFREGNSLALGDRKDEISLSNVELPSTIRDTEGLPTQYGFSIESSSGGAKYSFFTDTESALTQWTNDITRRVRALNIVAAAPQPKRK